MADVGSTYQSERDASGGSRRCARLEQTVDGHWNDHGGTDINSSRRPPGSGSVFTDRRRADVAGWRRLCRPAVLRRYRRWADDRPDRTRRSDRLVTHSGNGFTARLLRTPRRRTRRLHSAQPGRAIHGAKAIRRWDQCARNNVHDRVRAGSHHRFAQHRRCGAVAMGRSWPGGSKDSTDRSGSRARCDPAPA
jgi:hypothetical protein